MYLQKNYNYKKSKLRARRVNNKKSLKIEFIDGVVAINSGYFFLSLLQIAQKLSNKYEEKSPIYKSGR